MSCPPLVALPVVVVVLVAVVVASGPLEVTETVLLLGAAPPELLVLPAVVVPALTEVLLPAVEELVLEPASLALPPEPVSPVVLAALPAAFDSVSGLFCVDEPLALQPLMSPINKTHPAPRMIGQR